MTATYMVVEPSNGDLDMRPAPNAYEIGELVPTERPDLEGVAPVLYRLEHVERQLAHVQQLAIGHWYDGRPPVVCCIFETEAATDEVREHLASSLLLDKPGGGSGVFRYYDPRVYSHLRWILESSQMAALMGPVTRWSYLDETGSWQEARFDVVGHEKLTVTSEQYRQIARIALVRGALEPLRAAGIGIPQDLPRLLDRQLHKAERYGLTVEDQIPFALHGVLVAPNFDRHPKVQAVLSRSQETSYAEAIDQWSDEDWQRIKQESAQYPLD
jgi:hypothetical protein